MRQSNDPIAANIAQLIQRTNYLEMLDAEQGTRIGRTRELLAVAWATDELASLYPESMPEAYDMARGHAEWVASRKAQRVPQVQS
jgi:hypothetical protein